MPRARTPLLEEGQVVRATLGGYYGNTVGYIRTVLPRGTGGSSSHDEYEISGVRREDPTFPEEALYFYDTEIEAIVCPTAIAKAQSRLETAGIFGPR